MSVYSNNNMKNIRANDSWFKIDGFVQEGAHILDVGCSSGNLGKFLKKSKKASVVGVDIDMDDIKLAKKVLDEAHKIDLESDDLGFLGVFDVIIMADVIEHLVDPVNVLKKLRKLLNKDGIFIFSVPNMANVTIRMEILKGSFEYKDFGLLDKTHIHFYDHKEIERVLHCAGYSVVKTNCTIRTIPDDILRNELADIGIEYSDKLKKHFLKPDSSTFQFIGCAIPGVKESTFDIETTTPLDVITVEIDKMRSDFDSRLQYVEDELSRTTKMYDDAANTLNNIYRSKGWRMLTKFYGLKGIFVDDKKVK